jgi:hypothetical protein
MNFLLKKIPILFLLIITNCSFANKDMVIVPINSNPLGATVYINNTNFGKTPLLATLVPSKNYTALLAKKGYDTAQIDMEVWYSVRDGEGPDGKRCMADSSTILPMMIVLLFKPVKCSSFKESEYFVNLTRSMNYGGAEEQAQYKEYQHQREIENNTHNPYQQNYQNPQENYQPYANSYQQYYNY